MSPQAGPRRARRTPWRRVVSGGAWSLAPKPRPRVHSLRAAPAQPARSRRPERGAPGRAPVPAQVRARDPPPAPAGHSVLVASLAPSRVLQSVWLPFRPKRLGRALTSWARAPTRSDPGRDLAAPPGRSSSGFHPTRTRPCRRLSRPTSSWAPVSCSGSAFDSSVGLGLVGPQALASQLSDPVPYPNASS